MKYLVKHSTIIFIGMSAFAAASFSQTTVVVTTASPGPAAVSSPPPPAIVEQYDVQVEPSELADLGCKVSFDLSANSGYVDCPPLPQGCLDRISHVDSKVIAAQKDAPKLELDKEYAETSKKVGVQITFTRDKSDKKGSIRTLTDCKNSSLYKASAPVSTASLPEFRFNLPKGQGPLVGGFLDSSKKIDLSGDFARNDDYDTYKKLACTSCMTDADALSALDKLSDPLAIVIKGLRKDNKEKLFEKEKEDFNQDIVDEVAVLEKAKKLKLKDLKSVESGLLAIEKDIWKSDLPIQDRKDLIANIQDQIEKGLLPKAIDMNIGKSASEVKDAADFVAKTHTDLAHQPGLDADQKTDELDLAKAYAAGGSERMKVISAMDPAHPEVVAGLRQYETNKNTLYRDVLSNCYGSNTYNFVRCSDAQKKYSDLVGTASAPSPLQTAADRYNEVTGMNRSMNQGGQMQIPGTMPNNGVFSGNSNGAFNYSGTNPAQLYQNQFVANQTLNAGTSASAAGFQTAIPIVGVSPNMMGNQANGYQQLPGQYGFNNCGQVMISCGNQNNYNPMYNPNFGQNSSYGNSMYQNHFITN